MLYRALLAAIAVLSVVIISILAGLSAVNMVWFVRLLAISAAVFAIGNPRVIFMLALMLCASSLRFPGLPESMKLDDAIWGVVFGLMVLMALMKRIRHGFWTRQKTWMLLFLLVLLLTACIRGFGVKGLGSNLWGGFTYIHLIMISLFFISSGFVELNEKQWIATVKWLCLLSAIPMLAQLIYAISNGNLYHQFMFIKFDEQMEEFRYGIELGLGASSRLHVANNTSMYFFILAVWLFAGKTSLKAKAIVILIASILLAGLSGSRITLIFAFFTFVTFRIANRDRPVLSQLFSKSFAILFMMTVLLIALTPFLPMGLQRVFSVLPFAEQSQDVQIDAESTVLWRLSVWKEAWPLIKSHLLIGRGFAYSGEESMSSVYRQLGMNSTDFVILTRQYHHGLLQILLDLGLGGLICALGLIVSIFRTHWANRMRVWGSKELDLTHRIALAAFTSHFITFQVLGGGAAYIVTCLIWAIIMDGVARLDESTQQSPFVQ